MTDPAMHPKPMIAAMPPATASPRARSPTILQAGRQVARSRYSGERAEHQAECHAAGREQRDLRCVPDRHRVGRECQRADRGRWPGSPAPARSASRVRPRVPRCRRGVGPQGFGGRRRPCRTGEDASSLAATSSPVSPKADPRKSVASSIDSNVQKQWMTRTRKPLARNGPPRRLQYAVFGEVAAQAARRRRGRNRGRRGADLPAVRPARPPRPRRGETPRNACPQPDDDVDRRVACPAKPTTRSRRTTGASVRRARAERRRARARPKRRPAVRRRKHVTASDRPHASSARGIFPSVSRTASEAAVERVSKLDRQISHQANEYARISESNRRRSKSRGESTDAQDARRV